MKRIIPILAATAFVLGVSSGCQAVSEGLQHHPNPGVKIIAGIGGSHEKQKERRELAELGKTQVTISASTNPTLEKSTLVRGVNTVLCREYNDDNGQWDYPADFKGIRGGLSPGLFTNFDQGEKITAVVQMIAREDTPLMARLSYSKVDSLGNFHHITADRRAINIEKGAGVVHLEYDSQNLAPDTYLLQFTDVGGRVVDGAGLMFTINPKGGNNE